ncbi:UNVERIFIED_CONTAM: Retrovirus-related Pol polyprotein from type-1 retrotransposable element R2 [Sesamum radiatum]|uniref:Retrovirus-related Pol polyprotein from type-1 retrotransposable element R2 n=1 Tax=Sesamum radiatum TaxID=300843 RepID=A0AAW2IQE4_SESRA
MLPQWMFYVDYGGPGNRVWLAWDPSFVDVNVVETGAQFMHCSVFIRSLHSSVFITVVYGVNDVIGRRELWMDITRISAEGAADEFRGCLQDTGLIHLPMHGERFTWHNCSRDARSLWKRLDRLLVNDRWLELAGYDVYSTTILHGLLNSYQQYSGFGATILWGVQCMVTRKLKALKPIFRAQRQRKGDLSTNVALAKGFLESAQSMLTADRHCPTLLHLEFCCKLVYRLASRLEQKMLHQRAKMAWMKEGDQCSRVFFRKVAKRRASKRVFQINTTDGRTLTDQPEVIGEFIRYYEELLGGTTRDRWIDLRYLRPWARHILTVEEAEALTAPVSSTEIRQAIFDIDETKAPGPDGYSAGFFKAAWSVIGEEVTQALLDFFRTGRLLKQINATLISLIPKVNSPSVVAEFRPISCCNVLYKAVTKILVQRMRSILHTLISPSQNAFVPGRSIGDNVLLAQELFSGYNQRNLPPRCALKVDLRKAYDTVEWDFLKAALTLFGFPERFIQWIVECVTTTSYSVCINGAPHGFFRGARGLRQGDPMSPFCLFCKAEPNSIQLFKDGLIDFAELSGLQANLQKSHLILSRSAAAYRDSLLAILDFQEGHLPLRYLGLPLLASRLTISDCQPILRKMEARIKGWEGVMLSFAGRVQLIKSVLSALQVYWAMAFILPKHIIKEIEKRLRNFLWKGNLDTGLQESSVWTIRTRTGTWGWRKLIRLRDALRPHVHYQIGDGTSFSLWHDPWHPRGPLLPQFPLGPRHTALPPTAPLSAVISEDTWSWPHITDMESIDITHDLPAIHGGRDRIQWTGPRGSFSSAAAYDLFRPPGPTGRLSTTDKPWLQHLGSVCVLCQDGVPESHEHLFFMCPFASECIRAIRREVFFHWPYYNWSSVIRWASARWRGKHVVNAAYRALFASLVYHLWQERNSRIFQHSSRPTEEIVRMVVSETRDLIICKQLPRTVSTRGLYRLWRIPWPVEGIAHT